MKTFIGGIGCFWDETKYKDISGVISTECGYCGGDEPNVTYKAVCGGDTGHIEVVKVEYDEKIKSYEDMVRLFFELHDSTQVNRQGKYNGWIFISRLFGRSSTNRIFYSNGYVLSYIVSILLHSYRYCHSLGP